MPIHIEIPQQYQELKLKPGETETQFEVKIRNKSDRYASFHVQVKFYEQMRTDGGEQNLNWYQITPEVGTLTPPGDWTTFSVIIHDTPIPGFFGEMRLIVTVDSDELPDTARVIQKIWVEKGVPQDLQIELPVANIKEYPGKLVKIPVYVHNPNRTSVRDVQVRLLASDISPQQQQALNSSWCDRNVVTLFLSPNQKEQVIFQCQLPDYQILLAGNYWFKIEVTGAKESVIGCIEILPRGILDFGCQDPVKRIPAKFSWKLWQSEPVTYNLEFRNQSNVIQEIGLEIAEDIRTAFKTLTLNSSNTPPQEAITARHTLPPGDVDMSLVVDYERPWFGRAQNFELPIKATWSESHNLETTDENQNLELTVKPVLPLWLQLLGGAFCLWFLWWLSPYNPGNAKHQGAVNSVQFNGIADELISGSNDQTMIIWREEGFKPWKILTKPKIRQIKTGDDNKAVRVVRYRPVDNNLVAIGLENGQIQLWDLLSKSKQPLESFVFNQDDRVLDMEFSQNSRYLFTVHGSGLILQWDLKQTLNKDQKRQPVAQQKLNFAIQGIEFLGKDDQHLAIAGRYNTLILWDLPNKQLRPLLYPQGTQDNYIESIDTAENNPNLLVAADNQGNISLWDLKNCFDGQPGICGSQLEMWQGHINPKQPQIAVPVRSVALSDDGCYLASGGDDGSVKFWALSPSRTRGAAWMEGKTISRSHGRNTFNSVDIKIVDHQVLIASGSADNQVRVSSEKRHPEVGCDLK